MRGWLLTVVVALLALGPARVGAQTAGGLELAGQLGGTPRAVALEGSMAYLGAGTRLLAIDLSTPLQPRLLGRSPVLPGEIRQVQAAGGRVYVDSASALRAFDVSSPGAPREVASLAADGVAIAASGNLLYRAEFGALRVYDFADPAAPRLRHSVAALGPTSYTFWLRLEGSRLYMLDEDTLRVVAVSETEAPAELGRYTLAPVGSSPPLLGGLAASGDRVYLLEGGGLISIVSAADPTRPSRVGTLRVFPGSAIAAAGNLLYVTHLGDAGLIVYDTSDPLRPFEVGRVSASGVGGQVVLGGGRAHVVDPYNGLRLYDLTVATAPVALGTHVVPLTSTDRIAVVGTRGYALEWLAQRLWTLDLSDPADPRALGSYSLAGIYGQKGLAAAGEHAFVVGGDPTRLKVVDASDPTAPREVGSLDLGPPFTLDPYAYPMVASGRYLYLVAGSRLRVLDLADPSQPREVGSVDIVGLGEDVALAGDRLLIAHRGGMRVYDLSSPAAPREVGSLPFVNQFGASYAWHVAAAESRAYVNAGGTAEVSAVDLSDPAAPRRLGSTFLPGAYTSGLAAVGPYVAAIAGGALHLVRADEPACMSAGASLQLDSWEASLVLSTTHAYVAARGAGLVVARLPASLPRACRTMLPLAARRA